MYCSHFGLHRLPFNNTPDPTFYFSTPEHEEALATLQYATQERKGFVLVTGEVGAGKTLIGRMFLRLVQDQAQTAVITNTNLTGNQLLAALCAEFGIDTPRGANSLELTQHLQEYLLDQFAQDRYVVVLLDEGQNLPDEGFEELRMLGNLEADDAKLLQVGILGQPELRKRFKQPNMKQLDQRLFSRFHLPSLDRQQTESYITHRLHVAGLAGDELLFTTSAVDEIHTASQGTPRLINQICDNALLTAYGQDKSCVDETIVDVVLDRDPALRCHPANHAPAVAAQASTAVAVTADHAGTVESPANYTDTDHRIEEIYGSRPEITEVFADTPDSEPLARKAMDQAHELRTRVEQLSQAQPTRESVKGLAERQNELQRIIAGASEQWSTAKEKLDQDQSDVQQKLDAVVAQCRDAQNKLASLSERAVPANRLDEIRQNYERQTQDVLAKVERYRTEFNAAFDQTNRQWRETQERVHASATTAASTQDLKTLESHYEATIQKAFAQIDQSRNQVVELIHDVQIQCDENDRNLRTLKEHHAQTQAEALKQIKQRMDRQSQELNHLDQRIAGHLSSAEQRLITLKTECASSDDLQELRSEHTQAVNRIAEQFKDESKNLAAIKSEIERKNREIPEQLQPTLDALTKRTQTQVRHIRTIRQHLVDTHASTVEQITRLTEQFAKREELEELRETQRAKTKNLLQQMEQDRQTFQESFASREDLDQLRRDQDARTADTLAHVAEEQSRTQDQTRREIETLRHEEQQHSSEVLERIEANRGDIQAVMRELEQRCRSTEEALDALAEEQADGEEAVKTLRVQREEDFSHLRHQIEQQQKYTSEELERLIRAWQSNQEHIEALEASSTNTAELESLREQLGTNVKRIDEALDAQQIAVEMLASEITAHLSRLIDTAKAENNETIDELRAELKTAQKQNEQQLAAHTDALREERSRQIETLRHDLKTAQEQNEQQLAGHTETLREERSRQIETLHHDLNAAQEQNEQQLAASVESLRRNQQEQTVATLDRIERDRGELQQMIDGVVDRCRSAQEQIGTIAVSQVGSQDDLARLRDQQQQDIETLLEQVEGQRQHANSEIEHLVVRLKETQETVEAIQNKAVNPETIEELRERQTRDTQQICDALGLQRNETEKLIAQINNRLDEMVALIEALPEDIATTEDVEQVREQTTAQYNEMMTRIERENGEYQQDMADLNRRWEELTQGLEELAASSLGTEMFREAEQSFTNDLSQLDGRVKQITGVQQQCLHTVIQKMQQMSNRLNTLETRKPPEPVRIELTPKVGTSLAELIKAARTERRDLEALFDHAHTTAEYLEQSAAHVTEVVQNWEARAEDIQKQSDQLRASASVATHLMRAMKRCNETVDAKLKSERWQIELKQAEDLKHQLEEATSKTSRQLEQMTHSAHMTFKQLTAAITDIDRAKEEANAWSRRRADAEQVTDRLSRLLQRFDQTVNQRQEMLVHVAQSTADLADVIKSAGTEDEQRHPARAAAKRETPSEITDIQWPALRTHAAQAS